MLSTIAPHPSRPYRHIGYSTPDNAECDPGLEASMRVEESAPETFANISNLRTSRWSNNNVANNAPDGSVLLRRSSALYSLSTSDLFAKPPDDDYTTYIDVLGCNSTFVLDFSQSRPTGGLDVRGAINFKLLTCGAMCGPQDRSYNCLRLPLLFLSAPVRFWLVWVTLRGGWSS